MTETTEKENEKSPVRDEKIVEMRGEIDGIDNTLLSLINKRLNLATQIGAIKETKGTQVLDSARERSIMNRLFELNQGPLSKNVLHRIFMEIISESRELQRSHVVTYLGPEATFTHMAAMEHFGRLVSYVPQQSIRDVFVEVEKKTSDYGVVPVEHSMEGAVHHALDLFFDSDLKICAEIVKPVTHDLLSHAGSLKDVQKIYAHPHALAQCRGWLQKYAREITQMECGSTAQAALLAKQEHGAGAIANSDVADLYGLEVAASGIEDDSKNSSRFLVIGREDIHRTGKDITSLMLVTSHVSGALLKVLKPISDAGLNMLKLESRPSRHENWSYFFFVDIEAHMEDEAMKEAFKKMGEHCLYLKCLGSYPMVQSL